MTEPLQPVDLDSRRTRALQADEITLDSGSLASRVSSILDVLGSPS